MPDDLSRSDDAPPMAYAVVACSACHAAWTVETRHRTSSCPRCPAMVDLRRRRRLWQGDDVQTAQQAAAAFNTALAQGRPETEAEQALLELLPAAAAARHDSPVEAAAAKARAVVNLSARADLVALWLTRLSGEATDADYLESMAKAGLSTQRAEKEIIRMLATDVIYEPRAGAYRALQT